MVGVTFRVVQRESAEASHRYTGSLQPRQVISLTLMGPDFEFELISASAWPQHADGLLSERRRVDLLKAPASHDGEI